MFQAVVRQDDIDAPIEIIDGGVCFGRSSIAPFAHRLLRAEILDCGSAVAIVALERFADEPADTRHERLNDERALRARLEAHRDRPLDHMTIEIDRSERSVSITASAIHSAPIYLVVTGEEARIDWNYSRLLDGGEISPNWPMVMAQIAGIAPYSPTTLVEGLWRSTAGATLTVRQGKVSIQLPAATVLPGPQDLLPDTDVGEVVFDAIMALLAARPLDPRRTAVEVSGGMDSALTALASGRALGPGILSIGAQFEGAMGTAQRVRRDLLRDRGSFATIELPAERLAPFGPASLRRRRFGVWPQDENYPEIFETAFGILAHAGIDTLVSGFGGDELYVTYQGEEADDGAPDCSGHPYLTPRGAHLARAAANTCYPPGPLQETCWWAAASRSQRLLRHGLWPVYPYHSPALAAFVARLPYEYRKDRAVLRRLLTGLLDDPVFETDYDKENFRAVAVRGVIENQPYLVDLVRRSQLPRSGFLDDALILSHLSGDIAALRTQDFDRLYYFLMLCCFFQDGA